MSLLRCAPPRSLSLRLRPATAAGMSSSTRASAPAAPPPAPASITARLELPKVPPPASAAFASKERMAARVARDFRSDTLTVPSDAVIAAMSEASRGDDVYQEDATTTEFEAQLAALVGKEAALFCTSGTVSNQLAVRTHLTQPPYSLLCDMRAHVFEHEAGAAAMLTGAHTIPVLAATNGHHLVWEDLAPKVVPNDGDTHAAPTQLVCLENTLNGTIFPQDEIVRIGEEVHKRGIKLHLDGARLWNVSAETGTPLRELCAPFDSVNMCLSKGLGAPIGSVLAGSKAFIAKARHFRKAFGGGLRQTGPTAAAAREALQAGFPKLKATHELARYAQTQLADLGVHIAIPAETNMLFIDTQSIGVGPDELVERAAALPEPLLTYGQRFVFHLNTSPQAVQDLIALVAQLKQEKLDQGFDPSSENQTFTSAVGGIYGQRKRK